ncbi:SDR family NAD(P)-dependent oxidoreductase [Mycolicibacterium sp.]|uniref:SDR family NAD(P)-dependent oxidoreductase n=1 Tax=Mycolicibacterium sp. TaxID=2320850 RepID=UPI0028B19AD7|nr:SDR family NAD(P)-dependent oxidoreductase [Mycolicibacterium sp.]
MTVALITGAGRGLGSSLAIELAARGFKVAVHYHHSRSGAEATCDVIGSRGGEAEPFPGDLTSDHETRRMVADVAERWGRIDLLINNSGVYQEKPGLELTESEWFDGLNTTVTAAYFTSRACLPMLRDSPLKRVINIGDSACDHIGARDMAWSYHVGKSGVWLLTRSLAAQEAKHGLAVNMISPGYLDNSVGLPPAEDMPSGQFAGFADIHHAVRFLAFDAPSQLSGSNLVVSGGWNL